MPLMKMGVEGLTVHTQGDRHHLPLEATVPAVETAADSFFTITLNNKRTWSDTNFNRNMFWTRRIY